MRPTKSLLVLVALLLFSGVALAAAPGATLAIDRWVMGGGESSRAGGALQMQGTIGQPAVGYTTASALALYWGYWGPQPYSTYLPLILKKS
jgi:hypothetical protein